MQAVVFTHAPAALQVCGPKVMGLSEHCFAPGAQAGGVAFSTQTTQLVRAEGTVLRSCGLGIAEHLLTMLGIRASLAVVVVVALFARHIIKVVAF